MQSNKERRKLKGIPRKANAHRRDRKYVAYRNRVGKPNGPGIGGTKAGKNKSPGQPGNKSGRNAFNEV